MKKVMINSKPTTASGHLSSDNWVANRHMTTEPLKRLTFDIPLSLHQQFKSLCALGGENMADVMRMLLERHLVQVAPLNGSTPGPTETGLSGEASH